MATSIKKVVAEVRAYEARSFLIEKALHGDIPSAMLLLMLGNKRLSDEELFRYYDEVHRKRMGWIESLERGDIATINPPYAGVPGDRGPWEIVVAALPQTPCEMIKVINGEAFVAADYPDNSYVIMSPRHGPNTYYMVYDGQWIKAEKPLSAMTPVRGWPRRILEGGWPEEKGGSEPSP